MSMKKKVTKEVIITALQQLPDDKPLNKKLLVQYYKEGLLGFHFGAPTNTFGSLKNACDVAGIKCSCLYGKEHIKHMQKLNIKYNTKEKVIMLLKRYSKGYKTEELSPTDLMLYINKKNRIDLRGACKKFFGNLENAFKEAGIQTKKFYWTNDEIIKRLQEVYNEKNGKLNICDIKKSDNMPYPKSIRNKFKGATLDKIAEYAGINFVPFTDFKGTHFIGRLGLKEEFILDKIEEEKGIKLVRQYQVGRKFIDGFHIETNTAYEVDEPGHFHPYMQIRDYFRQEHIQKQTGCVFIRIKQDDFLAKLTNKIIN